MTILIDNNDGFAYNLYQYLAEIDGDIKGHKKRRSDS